MINFHYERNTPNWIILSARFKKGSDFHTCCDYRCFCVFAVSKAFLVYFNLN